MMKAWIVLIASLAFAVSPFLNPEFGGFDPERYPIPQDEPPVQPAGYAFGIWGVIYLWLIGHAVYGTLRRASDPVWARTRLPLAVSLIIGAAWLPVALVSPVWATVMIWGMGLSAAFATYRGRGGTPGWALSLPLGLYSGWLTAAACVALGLLAAGWGVLSETVAAYVFVILAIGLAAAAQMRLRGVWTYGLAAGWGLIAVAVRNWGEDWGLVGLSTLGAVAIAALILRQRHA